MKKLQKLGFTFSAILNAHNCAKKEQEMHHPEHRSCAIQ
jgi:hypothetical protein